MPPIEDLTPQEQAMLAAMMSYQNFGMPSVSSPGGQMNLFQDMMSTMADPTFMYLQGLLSDEQLLTDVEDLLFDPIDISEADWRQMEQDAINTGEELLVEGIALIREGMTVNQVIRALEQKFKDSYGDIARVDQNTSDSLKEDLLAFEEKWKKAVDIDFRVASGEFIRDAYGNVYKPVDEETGRKRLEGYGLDGFYATPGAWNVMLNPGEVDRSNKLLAEVSKLNEEKLNKQKAGIKESATTAQSAYKAFLNKTPEGRKILEQVSQPRPKEEKKQESKPWWRRGNVLDPGSLVRGSLVSPERADELIRSAARNAINGKDASAYIDDMERKKAGNQDYWAKLAASYAGRAAQDQKRKELERIDQQAKEKRAASDQAMLAARRTGSTQAMDMMKFAPYFASMVAAQSQGGGGGGGGGRPAPRTLSDQEIETMANMIAGGMG